jgi:hypothetical protein
VEALIGRRGNELRTNPDAVEFALDLTAEAIILHERTAHGGWKKFASAQLDDPELPMVIGLLRSEAETQIGGREPVRLWLPSEQVLKQRTRIEDGAPAARLRAAFDYIDRKTVYRPEDIAVAVAPANRSGETTLLITFAETWREARDYATRWGFIPGEVATRHHAGDFGADGPVFHLNSQPPEPIRRNRLAVAALVLAAVAAGAAFWSPRPWETPSGLPGTALEIADAPAANWSQATKLPEAAPLRAPEPEARAEALPPEHFPGAPALMSPFDSNRPPDFGTDPQTASPLAAPDASAAPAAMAAAPLPLPDPEPAPPGRDPVVAWTGPVPVLEPPGLSSPPDAQAISGVMEPAAWVDEVSLLARSASPPWAPPTVEPPPAEPATTPLDSTESADVAEASLPVPIPVPRPARTDPDGGELGTVADWNEPETEGPVALTKFASLTSPLPKNRPALPALPRELPLVATLPAITGPAQHSIWAVATERGLPLDSAALIGILNLGSARKALLRLPNGRYRSVIVGDVLDGWRVSMIGVDAMRITRSGVDRTFPLVNR